MSNKISEVESSCQTISTIYNEYLNLKQSQKKTSVIFKKTIIFLRHEIENSNEQFDKMQDG